MYLHTYNMMIMTVIVSDWSTHDKLHIHIHIHIMPMIICTTPRACSLASHSRSRSTLAARGPSGMSSTSYRWNRGYVCFFLQTFQDFILWLLFMMLGPLVSVVTGWWFSFRNYHPTSPLRYQLNWHPFTGWHNIGHDESKWPQKGAQNRDSMGILYTIYPYTHFLLLTALLRTNGHTGLY